MKLQYRIAPGISAVPRALFYFGEALHDGAPCDSSSRVRFLPVVPDPRAPLRRATSNRPRRDAEANPAEAVAIVSDLRGLGRSGGADGERILVITPYRAQERELAAAVDEARAEGALAGVEVEVCTLDRCQGREAEHVFISLVRGRSTPFLDAPKRWNVALTRAMSSLWIVGDIDSYLREARDARRAPGPPRMSLLALAIEAYERNAAITPSRSR